MRKAHHNVQDVLVHIDVETDMDGPRPGILPDREELTQVLADMLGAGVPQPMQVRLHYLGGKVEAELYLPFEWLQEDDRASRLQARISSAAEEHPRSGRSCFMRWLHTDGASCFQCTKLVHLVSPFLVRLPPPGGRR